MIRPTILGMLCLLLTACSYLHEPIENCAYLAEERDHILIETAHGVDPKFNLIYYPGGLVDPNAYTQMACSLVNFNAFVRVFIAKMPGNLAVFDADAALDIIDAYPDYDNWFIAGHSLGGAMACQAVDQNRELFEGLILLGAYPAASLDLSDWSGKVLSLSAEFDQLASPDEIEDSKSRLPQAVVLDDLSDFPDELDSTTVFFEIKGGNHAQFGYYEPQKGDGQATISTEFQHSIIVNAINYFIYR